MKESFKNKVLDYFIKVLDFLEDLPLTILRVFGLIVILGILYFIGTSLGLVASLLVVIIL